MWWILECTETFFRYLGTYGRPSRNTCAFCFSHIINLICSSCLKELPSFDERIVNYKRIVPWDKYNRDNPIQLTRLISKQNHLKKHCTSAILV